MKSELKKYRDHLILICLILFIVIYLPIAKIYYPFRIDNLLDEAVERYELNDIQTAEKQSLKVIDTCEKYERIILFRGYWNYGNAIHKAHTILGLIYLARNDVVSARKQLLLAGETPGSPQLDTFGPSMILANELLKLNEGETVIQYFELCESFWKKNILEDWIVSVEKGGIPRFDKRQLRL